MARFTAALTPGNLLSDLSTVLTHEAQVIPTKDRFTCRVFSLLRSTLTEFRLLLLFLTKR